MLWGIYLKSLFPNSTSESRKLMQLHSSTKDRIISREAEESHYKEEPMTSGTRIQKANISFIFPSYPAWNCNGKGPTEAPETL